jgi:tight adherence protein B
VVPVLTVLTVLFAVGGAVFTAALARSAGRVPARERARGLGARSLRRLPARPRAWLVRHLEDAGVAMEPEAVCELALAVAGAAGILAYAIAPALAVPAALATLLAGPIALRMARGRTARRYAVALPAGLEQVAAELRGGGTVAGAVGTIARAGGPLAADLRRVEARTELGVGLVDALGAWPEERAVDGVRAAAGALAVAAALGGRAADALDGLARSLRDRLGAAAEAGALSAQARLSAVVVGAAPIAYLAFSTAVDPTSTASLVTTTPGRVCLALGMGCEVLGALWMRRIVRTVP